MASNVKKIKAGYVYILGNSALPDVIKVGEAIDAEERARFLSKQTGAIGEYTVLWKHKVEDNNQAVEKALHYKLREFSLDKEYFTSWEHDYHLFLLGVVSFFAAFIARKAVLRKWAKWSVIHISGMALSYIFLVIAFYVDNGRFLPFWKDLDPVFYWLLPLIIGLPLTIWSLLTNPLTRHYFSRRAR